MIKIKPGDFQRVAIVGRLHNSVVIAVNHNSEKNYQADGELMLTLLGSLG